MAADSGLPQHAGEKGLLENNSNKLKIQDPTLSTGRDVPRIPAKNQLLLLRVVTQLSSNCKVAREISGLSVSTLVKFDGNRSCNERKRY